MPVFLRPQSNAFTPGAFLGSVGGSSRSGAEAGSARRLSLAWSAIPSSKETGVATAPPLPAGAAGGLGGSGEPPSSGGAGGPYSSGPFVYSSHSFAFSASSGVKNLEGEYGAGAASLLISRTLLCKSPFLNRTLNSSLKAATSVSVKRLSNVCWREKYLEGARPA